VGGRSFGCGSPLASGCEIEQEMSVRGAQEWGKRLGGEGERRLTGALDSSDNGR
jgi:hypothetical protein